jgi:hypothetical protein
MIKLVERWFGAAFAPMMEMLRGLPPQAIARVLSPF